jgi:hypothetical protein
LPDDGASLEALAEHFAHTTVFDRPRLKQGRAELPDDRRPPRTRKPRYAQLDEADCRHRGNNSLL